jgi:hypothetical protein
MTTPDPIAEYFDNLAARGHEPLLERASGTLRFDVVGDARTERWRLAVSKGDLAVSRGSGRADAVLRAERPTFERLVRGQANGLAALLRGAITLEGRPELIVMFQRLLPRPLDTPAARRPSRRQR